VLSVFAKWVPYDITTPPHSCISNDSIVREKAEMTGLWWAWVDGSSEALVPVCCPCTTWRFGLVGGLGNVLQKAIEAIENTSSLLASQAFSSLSFFQFMSLLGFVVVLTVRQHYACLKAMSLSPPRILDQR